HRITGRQHLEWRNTQAVPAATLAFHLYLNAFKNEDSVFMRESRRGEGRDWQEPTAFGWIDVKSMRAGDLELRERATIARCAEDEPVTANCKMDETVMDVALPTPVPSGGRIDLDMEFEAQLPEIIARSGYAGDFHMVGQWFPKLGVFEAIRATDGSPSAAWNCHAYHADSEFFADFGEYVVELTVPAEVVVGATGVLTERRATAGGGRKQTLVFHAEDVHDFAWTADRSFHIQRDRYQDIDVTVLYHAGQSQAGLTRELRAVKAALALLGQTAFPYPYRTLTIVEPSTKGIQAGGMEYPTLVTTAPGFLLRFLPGVREIESVTIHEFTHQYFYGMIASNEFEEPWLDEGLTEYTSGLVQELMFGAAASDFNLAGFYASYFAAERRSYARRPDFDAPET